MSKRQRCESIVVNLNIDVYGNIFKYIDIIDEIENISNVSKEWNSICRNSKTWQHSKLMIKKSNISKFDSITNNSWYNAIEEIDITALDQKEINIFISSKLKKCLKLKKLHILLINKSGARKLFKALKYHRLNIIEYLKFDRITSTVKIGKVTKYVKFDSAVYDELVPEEGPNGEVRLRGEIINLSYCTNTLEVLKLNTQLCQTFVFPKFIIGKNKLTKLKRLFIDAKCSHSECIEPLIKTLEFFKNILTENLEYLSITLDQNSVLPLPIDYKFYGLVELHINISTFETKNFDQWIKIIDFFDKSMPKLKYLKIYCKNKSWSDTYIEYAQCIDLICNWIAVDINRFEKLEKIDFEYGKKYEDDCHQRESIFYLLVKSKQEVYYNPFIYKLNNKEKLLRNFIEEKTCRVKINFIGEIDEPNTIVFQHTDKLNFHSPDERFCSAIVYTNMIGIVELLKVRNIRVTMKEAKNCKYEAPKYPENFISSDKCTYKNQCMCNRNKDAKMKPMKYDYLPILGKFWNELRPVSRCPNLTNEILKCVNVEDQQNILTKLFDYCGRFINFNNPIAVAQLSSITDKFKSNLTKVKCLYYSSDDFLYYTFREYLNLSENFYNPETWHSQLPVSLVVRCCRKFPEYPYTRMDCNDRISPYGIWYVYCESKFHAILENEHGLPCFKYLMDNWCISDHHGNTRLILPNNIVYKLLSMFMKIIGEENSLHLNKSLLIIVFEYGILLPPPFEK